MNEIKDLNWFTDITEKFMSRGYFNEGEDIHSTIKNIAEHSANILGKGKEYSDKLENYLKKGFYVVPTPVWKNFNSYSDESPISCFGVVIDDSVKSIMTKSVEVAMQNKIGGGTSGTFSFVRPRGSKINGVGKTNGAVSMMEIYQTVAKIISQPNRRGHFSATLDIEHDDFEEFIGAMRDEHPLQTISTSVTISDRFINKVLEGDDKSVKRFNKLVKARYETGFPYIFFSDNVNNNRKDIFKLKGKYINHSNMCQEILLPNSSEETFVCCLLGMNAELFDYWKDTDAVEVGIYFMDSMLQDYINKVEREKKEDINFYNLIYKPSVDFVKNYLSVGMGQSGLHSYMQSKGIAFHSFEGLMTSNLIQKTIYDQSHKASEKMAKEYGRAKIFEGTDIKRRHSTLTAIAPNTSSSFIMNMQSQSIEPYTSNYYVKDVVNVKTPIKNPYLKKVLEKHGKDNKEVWDDILKHNGSVQHLEFLTEHEKNVFKTFLEIPQDFVLEMASGRQKFLCQSQSLNLMIGKNVEAEYVTYLILKAWKLGIRTLYYQLNVSGAQEFKREHECVSCSA